MLPHNQSYLQDYSLFFALLKQLESAIVFLTENSSHPAAISLIFSSYNPYNFSSSLNGSPQLEADFACSIKPSSSHSSPTS